MKRFANDRIEKRAKRLANRIEKYKHAADSQKVGFWKGRKIVSEREWRDLVLSGRDDVFDYMPSNFVHTPFFMYSKFDSNIEKVKNWWVNYIGFLEDKKNPAYGEQLCGKCILRPKYVHVIYDNSDTFDIKDAVAADFIQKVKIPVVEEKSPYPCPVANRFKCPFKDAENWNDTKLTKLGEIVDFLCEAIHYAGYLYENTFYLDFDKNRINVLNYFGRYEEELAPIQKGMEKLIEFERSNLLLRTAEDVFRVLHDKKMLRRLVQQYPDAKKLTKRDRELYIQSYWDIHEIFTIDKLRGPNGETAEESRTSEIEFDGTRPHANYTYWPFCHVCNRKWVTIECVQCRKRVCTEHWRQHRDRFHTPSYVTAE